MDKNILITGANGQLGNEFNSIKENYPEFNFIFVTKEELNITDNTKVIDFLDNNSINYLINCAAYTAVDNAEENTDLAHSINVEGPELLAKACNKIGAILLHVSTDYVFDGKNNDLYNEEDKTSPLSVYGKTKLLGEIAIKANCKVHYIIRTSWLYSTFNSNFVKSMLKLAETRNELGIVADQFGSPTYAKDLAKAIMTLIKKTDNGSVKNQFGVYHYSNEHVTTWCDFAKEIMTLAKTNCIVKPITTEEYPVPAPRPKNSSMSKEKIKSTFKLTIPKWEDSLRTCLNELLK